MHLSLIVDPSVSENSVALTTLGLNVLFVRRLEKLTLFPVPVALLAKRPRLARAILFTAGGSLGLVLRGRTAFIAPVTRRLFQRFEADICGSRCGGKFYLHWERVWLAGASGVQLRSLPSLSFSPRPYSCTTALYPVRMYEYSHVQWALRESSLCYLLVLLTRTLLERCPPALAACRCSTRTR